MSTLETNAIGKYSGDNVSIDDALNLKSYDTTARDGLTSVAGDTIYNTTTGKVEYYDGSAWQETGATTFNMDYLLVAGGGGGGMDNYTGDSNGRPSTGGGSAGVLTSYASEFAGPLGVNKPTFSVLVGQSYTVSIGGGGTAGNASSSGNINGGGKGTETGFAEIQAIGGTGGSGGYGGTYMARADGSAGASGTGGNYLDRDIHLAYIPTQAYGGGDTSITSSGAYPGAGSGGAGAVGGSASSSTGGAGGAGMVTTIISDSQATSASVGEVDSGNVYVGGGGGGKGNTSNGPGGLGGGGNGSTKRANNSTNGTDNTGGGGGAGSANNSSAVSGAGGSGLVILRYPNTYTASTTGLTTSTASSGSDSILIITAGTGTVSFE
jgi:hypothetical protein